MKRGLVNLKIEKENVQQDRLTRIENIEKSRRNKKYVLKRSSTYVTDVPAQEGEKRIGEK
jgi:hypothetical protein